MRRLLVLASIVLILCGASLTLAGWREAISIPRIVFYDIASTNWPEGSPSLRIVQLTDTHHGAPVMSSVRLDLIVAQVNALTPDIVVLTGDYHGGRIIDGDIGNLDHALRPFARLRSRYGTFAVRGNHDTAYWSRRVIPRYKITYLENASADAGPVAIAGVDDLRTGRPSVKRALAGIAAGKPIVMLMHEPAGFADVPPDVALTLAGHTHGGQIRLPLIGSPWMPEGAGRYLRGLYVEQGRRMIVSSGLGTTALPLRIGVPPEIVVVTLHR